MSIEVQHVSKKFGDFVALDDVTFSVPPGELVALLGPSGGGKTTMLRIIAGLEAPDSGVVLLEGEDATERSARDRGVGFVFQHYALFRHMTVFENVAFGLRVRARHVRPPAGEIKRRVHDLLNLVQLNFLADRLPSQLSGGQRQRVALARALLTDAEVLVLVEPTSAVDAHTEATVAERLVAARAGRTTVLVTASPLLLDRADEVVLLAGDRVLATGTHHELLHRDDEAGAVYRDTVLRGEDA
jgi:sulfate transport system ATP-binding protein